MKDTELLKLKDQIEEVRSLIDKADVMLLGIFSLDEDDPIRNKRIEIAQDILELIHDRMCHVQSAA